MCLCHLSSGIGRTITSPCHPIPPFTSHHYHFHSFTRFPPFLRHPLLARATSSHHLLLTVSPPLIPPKRDLTSSHRVTATTTIKHQSNAMGTINRTASIRFAYQISSKTIVCQSHGPGTWHVKAVERYSYFYIYQNWVNAFNKFRSKVRPPGVLDDRVLNPRTKNMNGEGRVIDPKYGYVIFSNLSLEKWLKKTSKRERKFLIWSTC